VLVFRLTGSGLGLTGAVIAEIAPVLLARWPVRSSSRSP
jgi:hypothetical protein